MSFFELVHTDSQCKARAGLLTTDHGVIETPIFMPVGTQAAVKAVNHAELPNLGVQIILGNTYHLYLRPGDGTINDFGGLHKFMNWSKPILTDSGGYQVFSLQEIRKIREEGVEFRSHIDGSKHFFSPAKVIDIQRNLGSDIIMVLDECAPYPAERKYVEKSVELSLKWAKSCLDEFNNSQSLYGHTQRLFAIAQGGMHKDLRRRYLEEIINMDFDSYAIGGLSVGEPTEMMYEITDLSTDLMPKDKPRYLMGVGTPENILECIEMGIDMFDCVMPTRNARNGTIFTTTGKVNIRNAKFKNSKEILDQNLENYYSQNFTFGYMHHLFKSGEILGLTAATMQNIAFYMWLVRTAREKIISNQYTKWKNFFLNLYSIL